MVSLLEHPDFEPNIKDDFGHTAISYAARYPQGQIIDLLLEYKGVEIEIKDERGRSLLSYAVEGDVWRRGFLPRPNHPSAVELLARNPDLDVNYADKGGMTPLSWAAKLHNYGATKLLLDRDDIVADAKNQSGLTPLFLAFSGYKGSLKHERTQVAEMLLQRAEATSGLALSDLITQIFYASDHSTFDMTCHLLLLFVRKMLSEKNT